ncbi:MAG: fibronectin type III domain-containing protein [Clostridiales bacterium]|nr:fibronectin type III domain-containing protein [Clostridiales bacterium]
MKNTTSGVKVTWKKVSGASGYYVYRKTTSGSYKKIKTISSASTLSYKDTAVKSKNGKTYKYCVVPYYKSSAGNITKGSHSVDKKIVRLTTVTLSSVKNTSSKKITVKWKKNSKASGYQIQYSTSKSFSSSKKVTVSGASKLSKKIGSLKKGKTYYVRVRAYKKTSSGTKYYSAWSSKKSVKITT